MSIGWRYLLALLVGVVLGAGVAGAWQGKTIDVLTVQRDAARGTITELQGVNAQCGVAVDLSKTAVAELVRLDAERSAIAHAAVEAAKGRATVAEGRARFLQRRPPSDPANTCASITDLRQDYMNGRAAQ
jgi:hypothetical protein